MGHFAYVALFYRTQHPCYGCRYFDRICSEDQQQRKIQILSHLLSNYNDGRRKNFFCVAVNLLELSELQEIMKQLQFNNELSSLSAKEQCLYVVETFQKIANRKSIELKLIKKK